MATTAPKPNASDAYRRKLPHWYGTMIGCLVVLVYLLVYFTTTVGGEGDRLRHRAQALWNILLPDEILRLWLGGGNLPVNLLEKVYLISWTLAILAIAWLWGAAVMRRLGWDRDLARLESATLATGVGLNCLSLLVLGCGLAGVIHLIWPALISLAVFSAVLLTRKRTTAASPEASHSANLRESQEGKTWVSITLWTVAGLLTLLTLFAGAMPPNSYDVREYHLQIPKEWYQQGYIGFVEHNIYGNMPFGAEMHALLMMPVAGWWWGAIIGKTVIAAFLPLTALLLFVIGRRLFGRTAGYTAMLVFLSFPRVFHNSVAGLIDTCVAFYFVAATYVVMIAKPDGPESTWCLRRLALAGFLAGSAVACKYPPVLFLVIPLFLWIVAGSRWHWRPAFVFTVTTFAACGLWFGKNVAFTGNPVYPLVYEIFGGRSRTPEKHEQWKTAHRVDRQKMTAAYLWVSIKELLWEEKRLNPALIPLALLAIGNRQRRWLLLPLLICLFDFVAWWLLTHRLDRFLLPTYGVVAICSGAGAQWFSSHQVGKSLLGLLLGLSLVLSFFLMAGGYYGDVRLLVSVSHLRADVPNEPDSLNTRVHRAHRYLNEHVKPGDHVLCVGEAQVFDLEVGTYYNTCFDDCILETLMKGKSRAERLKNLQDRRITHVFIHWSEIRRFRSPGNYGYTDYITEKLIRQELSFQQQILIPVPPTTLNLAPSSGEVYRVAPR